MTWTLHLGDCLDPVTGLASLPDKSVDHVITDPPYDEHTHKAGRRGETTFSGDAGNGGASLSRARALGFDALKPEQMIELGAQFARISKRWIAVFCSIEMIGDSAKDNGCGWRASLERSGLQYIRTAAWHKLGSTPQFTGDRPAQAIEAVVLAHPRGRKRWNGGGKHGFYEFPIVLNRGSATPRLHTTQKPLELMLSIVEDFTDPGDVVLDPFSGSGTTGLACRILGRDFIGWERDVSYHGIATRRMSGEEAKPSPEQTSLF